MKKIVVLDGFTLNPGDLKWTGFAKLGDLTVYDRTPKDRIIQRARGAEILLTNKTVLTEAEMSRLPDVEYIGVFATGYNVVDVKAARKYGITVTNLPTYSTMSVAQQMFALLLSITNHAEHYADQDRRGRWTASPDFAYVDTPLIELSGKTFGIVGFGHIGQASARMAQAFGMKVMAFSSKTQEELGSVIKAPSLDDLFRESDVVALCCPLNDETKGMVNSHLIGLLKPSAIFINTARGGLVDEQALANALRSHRIHAAGLDVLTIEPPMADNPLRSLPNCYITPHIAWATHEARVRCMDTAVENLRAYLDGHPQNVVS